MYELLSKRKNLKEKLFFIDFVFWYILYRELLFILWFF